MECQGTDGIAAVPTSLQRRPVRPVSTRRIRGQEKKPGRARNKVHGWQAPIPSPSAVPILFSVQKLDNSCGSSRAPMQRRPRELRRGPSDKITGGQIFSPTVNQFTKLQSNRDHLATCAAGPVGTEIACCRGIPPTSSVAPRGKMSPQRSASTRPGSRRALACRHHAPRRWSGTRRVTH